MAGCICISSTSAAMGAMHAVKGGVQAVQQVQTTVQAASKGVPQLLMAAAPSAVELLGTAKRASDLPGLPAMLSSTSSFETPALLMGEMLS